MSISVHRFPVEELPQMDRAYPRTASWDHDNRTLTSKNVVRIYPEDSFRGTKLVALLDRVKKEFNALNDSSSGIFTRGIVQK